MPDDEPAPPGTIERISLATGCPVYGDDAWREDGVVQIQKKQCGEYTVLKRDNNYGAPSKHTWHTIRFEIAGTSLRLYLDGTLAMTVADDSETPIAYGTAGIRIDSAEGSLIDDWKVYAP